MTSARTSRDAIAHSHNNATLLEVAHMLVLSTEHISPDTAQNWMPLCPWACFEKADFGWFMYAAVDVGIIRANDLPAEIHAALDVAKRENCEWIMWDCDGPCIDELPQFAWDHETQVPA